MNPKNYDDKRSCKTDLLSALLITTMQNYNTDKIAKQTKEPPCGSPEVLSKFAHN